MVEKRNWQDLILGLNYAAKYTIIIVLKMPVSILINQEYIWRLAWFNFPTPKQL